MRQDEILPHLACVRSSAVHMDGDGMGMEMETDVSIVLGKL